MTTVIRFVCCVAECAVVLVVFVVVRLTVLMCI